jgi:DNA-binding MarR family transcriptional regulator
MDAMVSELEQALTRTLRTFRRLLHEEAKARALTQAQYAAMRRMQVEGECRMGDLATYLELTNGACTALVERLTERTLVTRREAPEDGRVVLVSLTPSGRDLVAEMDRGINASLAAVVSGMSVPERHMALGGLTALADAFETPQPQT